MKIQNQITEKLTQFFQPKHLEIVNESHKHRGRDGMESHFKVLIVSEKFEGKSLLQKHREVHEVLEEELQHIHALAIEAKTPEQWESVGHQARDTPNCVHR